MAPELLLATHASSGEMSGSWEGFGGRVFLTPEEHATYLRRPPVRYAARGLAPHQDVCEVCGGGVTPDNPLQASHLVPFLDGVRKFWLTPDWLDGPHNLGWAHKRVCNKAAEILTAEVVSRLWEKFHLDVEARVEPTVRGERRP